MNTRKKFLITSNVMWFYDKNVIIDLTMPIISRVGAFQHPLHDDCCTRPIDAPNTNDNSYLELWFTLMIMSLLGLTGCFFGMNKKKFSTSKVNK